MAIAFVFVNENRGFMKAKILLTALMITMISLTVSTSASAHPWRYRGGWGHGHASIFVPPIPIPVPAPVVVSSGYYGGGGYCGPNYNRGYGHRYNDRAYYDRAYYGRGGYCRPQRNYGYSYGNSCGRGNYGPRGNYYRR